MLKKISIGLAVLTAAVTAGAEIIISDVSYTADSLTFTMTGDLSGYTEPDSTRLNQLTIGYSGDLCSLDTGSYVANSSWSASPFQDVSISSSGYTGAWDVGTPEPYTWATFDQDLSSSSQASGTSVTVNFSGDALNTEASSGDIIFYWGFSQSGYEYTEIGRSTVIPEPATLGLIGLFGGGLLAVRRLFMI